MCYITLASSFSSTSVWRGRECLGSSLAKIALGCSSSDSLSDGGSLIQASRSRLHTLTHLYFSSVSYSQIKLNNNAIFTHPSGTGTFFWALGATGLSSPANRALTSSATSTSFCCSFWMYFTSCRMQEAWEQNRQKSESWQVSNGIYKLNFQQY